MCEVCAVFGVSEHWADSALVKDLSFPARDIQEARIARREQLALLGGILARHQLTCNDWDGEGYLVEAASGKREVVANLQDLWGAAERLSGHRFDPLDAGDLPVSGMCADASMRKPVDA
jgi:hypothetical protein